LRERMIGAEMFNRPVDYDTANDSVVRVKATELRKKLIQAYAELNDSAKVRIEVPPGTYVPKFIFRADEAASINTAVDARPAEQKASEGEPQVRPEDPAAEWPVVALIPVRRDINIRRWAGATVIAIGIGAILFFVGIRVWHGRGNAQAQIRSIAVLPFENLSGDPKQEYFADGMTEELISDLGQMSALHVISRTSAMSFKGSRKELPEIAHELSVDAVVEGSVLRDGSQVRITARLIDAKTDRPIWGENFIRSSSDVLASEGELARSVASQLSLTISPQTQAHLARSASISMGAEDLYLQGMLNFHSGNCENAMGYFQKAIKADAKFANAYAALANCYGLLGSGGWIPYSEAFSNEKSNALRAVEFDNSLSEGHSELADALVNADWNFAGAEKEFNQALALNPNSARVHEQYGDYLDLVGNPSTAIEEGQIAVKLDPLSARALSDLAYIYYFSRQYDQALALLKMAESKDPNLHADVFAYGDVYAEKGQYQESINEFLKLGDNPHALGHLGNAYARAGQSVSARKIIAQLQEHVKRNQLGAYEIALVYAGLGQKDEAFVWLQRAFENHDRGIVFLKVDPALDPLRADPRFDSLLQQAGFVSVGMERTQHIENRQEQ
jgi:TolB-like protein